MSEKDIFDIPPLMAKKAQQRLATVVAPLNKQKKALNAQQWKFVQELVSGDGEVGLREAAIRAGFPVNSAARLATRMTDPAQSPQIVAAIQAYRSQLGQRYGTTFERHMRDLQRIRDAAMTAGAYGAAVQAEFRRGQALGTIYVERKEIRHGTIDAMSKEEVQRKLEEIKQLYGGPPMRIIEMAIEDVVPTIETDPVFAERAQLDQIPPLADLEAAGEGPDGAGDDSGSIGGDSGREA